MIYVSYDFRASALERWDHGYAWHWAEFIGLFGIYLGKRLMWRVRKWIPLEHQGSQGRWACRIRHLFDIDRSSVCSNCQMIEAPIIEW